jgi:hypothetical protein
MRMWRCAEPACATRTWSETGEEIRPRATLTERARRWACRRVGDTVAGLARELGVGSAPSVLPSRSAAVRSSTTMTASTASGRRVQQEQLCHRGHENNPLFGRAPMTLDAVVLPGTG